MGGVFGIVNAAGDRHRVRACAPGRITVFLAVGGADLDGRYPLAGASQAVSVHDDVSATPADGFTVERDGVDAGTAPVPGEGDLAVRAARLLATELGRTDGVRLRVTRRIPTGGLGASAADAAATLVACDALWDAGLSMKTLRTLAARVRADVPFALAGGTAVGGEDGDLSRALAHGRFDWVIVASEQRIAPGSVYRELESVRSGPQGAVVHTPVRPVVFPPVLQALRRGDAHLLARASGNDLESAVLRCCPELDDVISEGLSSGALTGIVSGTGPVLAFLAEDAQAAIDLQVSMSAAGHRAVHVYGPVPGARVIAA